MADTLGEGAMTRLDMIGNLRAYADRIEFTADPIDAELHRALRQALDLLAEPAQAPATDSFAVAFAEWWRSAGSDFYGRTGVAPDEALQHLATSANVIANAADAPQGEAPAPRICKAKPTADPPQDCDWPLCGCDEHATKVIDALQEMDMLKPSGGLDDEPSVMGGGVWPLPSPPTGVELIDWCVRLIQQTSDGLNLDPAQWLNDPTAQPADAPQGEAPTFLGMPIVLDASMPPGEVRVEQRAITEAPASEAADLQKYPSTFAEQVAALEARELTEFLPSKFAWRDVARIGLSEVQQLEAENAEHREFGQSMLRQAVDAKVLLRERTEQLEKAEAEIATLRAERDRLREERPKLWTAAWHAGQAAESQTDTECAEAYQAHTQETPR